MTMLTSLARALAVETGGAQRIRTVRHVHLSERPLVFIPLQLAGEACAPLAAMVGDDPATPRLLVVYEPRNRTDRFAFAAALGEVILGYLGSFTATEPAAPGDPYPDAPQLLVPNPGGIAFTKLLGRSTRFRRTEGEHAVAAEVPLLGRWLSYLADRCEYPSSAMLLPLTTVLAGHWATGQSATEDGNLATVLGWIDPPDGVPGRRAAAAAEDPVLHPPAGPATDPSFDREVLADRLNAVRTARQAGDDAALARARLAMDGALRTQLAPTWELMWRAVGLLRELPAAAHATEHWEWDRKSFTSQVAWQRDAGVPQARRDSAVRAARKLESLERDAQRVIVHQAYDDELVMGEYRMTGEAFAGIVTEVDLTRYVLVNKQERPRPLITVESTDEVTFDNGAQLRSPRRPGQDVEVRDVIRVPGDRTRVTLIVLSGMGRAKTPAPGSVPAVGERVTYTTLKDDFRKPPPFPPREETPWTHGGPPDATFDGDPAAAEESVPVDVYWPTDDDAGEPWS